MLIYLSDGPNIDDNVAGTSVYTPIDRSFCCNRGTHYKNKNFNKVYTASLKRIMFLHFIELITHFMVLKKLRQKIYKRKLIQYSIWQGNNQAA